MSATVHRSEPPFHCSGWIITTCIWSVNSVSALRLWDPERPFRIWFSFAKHNEPDEVQIKFWFFPLKTRCGWTCLSPIYWRPQELKKEVEEERRRRKREKKKRKFWWVPHHLDQQLRMHLDIAGLEYQLQCACQCNKREAYRYCYINPWAIFHKWATWKNMNNLRYQRQLVASFMTAMSDSHRWAAVRAGHKMPLNKTFVKYCYIWINFSDQLLPESDFLCTRLKLKA